MTLRPDPLERALRDWFADEAEAPAPRRLAPDVRHAIEARRPLPRTVSVLRAAGRATRDIDTRGRSVVRTGPPLLIVLGVVVAGLITALALSIGGHPAVLLVPSRPPATAVPGGQVACPPLAEALARLPTRAPTPAAAATTPPSGNRMNGLLAWSTDAEQPGVVHLHDLVKGEDRVLVSIGDRAGIAVGIGDASTDVTLVEGLAWSPDGSRLAVAVDVWPAEGGPACGGIVVVDPGGAVAPLVLSPDPIAHIAWSPDGTRLAYGTDPQGAIDHRDVSATVLRTIGADGADGWARPGVGIGMTDIDWSLDGRWITTPARLVVSTVAADDGAPATEIHARTAWWLPDRRLLVETDGRLIVADPASLSADAPVTGSVIASDVGWVDAVSPGRDLVAYARQSRNASGDANPVALLSLVDGTSSDLAPYLWPIADGWAPDGRTLLAWGTGGVISLASIDGSTPVTTDIAADPATDHLQLSWQTVWR